MAYDNSKVYFLDVEIRRAGNTLQTEVYRSPPGANSYLTNDKFPPKPSKEVPSIFPVVKIEKELQCRYGFSETCRYFDEPAGR